MIGKSSKDKSERPNSPSRKNEVNSSKRVCLVLFCQEFIYISHFVKLIQNLFGFEVADEKGQKRGKNPLKLLLVINVKSGEVT